MSRRVRKCNGKSLGSRRGSRSGVILLLVLVVLATLILAAYTFSESMTSEYRALRSAGDQARLQATAESGVEAILTTLHRPAATAGSPRPLAASATERIEWTDSIGNRYTAEIRAGPWGTEQANRAGVSDESAKLNLNALSLEDELGVESRNRLLALPGMTPTIADSLLDWMDADDLPRDFGAEGGWYAAKGLPYRPRNGPLETLKEMLLIRGVEFTQLFGEDANANGWLDYEEDDGSLSFPPDNEDGKLDRGWSRWLSISAAESNLTDQGEFKVYVNQDSMVTLFRELEPLVGSESAQFIVALRMNGPMNNEGADRFDSPAAIAKRRATAAARSRRQRTETITYGSIQQEIINGFSIDRAGVYVIESMADLIDQRTEARIFGEEKILQSPWPDVPQRVAATLAWLESRLTTQTGQRLLGRINLHQADREVLMTIPGMKSDLANLIVDRQQGRDAMGSRDRGAGWLYQNGLIDLPQLRRFAPYLTGHGDVYSGMAVGTVSDSPQKASVAFLIDATGRNPRVRRLTLETSAEVLDNKGGLSP